MLLKSAIERKLLTSPSLRRWLAHGDIPNVNPPVGREYDLTLRDLVVCKVFEIGASFGNLELARALAIEAHQKIRADIISPLVATGPHWRLEIDLASVMSEVNV